MTDEERLITTHVFDDDGTGNCYRCGEGLDAHKRFVIRSADGTHGIILKRSKRVVVKG
jgi:hypothetical protein